MDAPVAADTLTRWHRDGTGLDVLEGLVKTIDEKLERLRGLPLLAPFD